MAMVSSVTSSTTVTIADNDGKLIVLFRPLEMQNSCKITCYPRPKSVIVKLMHFSVATYSVAPSTSLVVNETAGNTDVCVTRSTSEGKFDNNLEVEKLNTPKLNVILQTLIQMMYLS